MSLNLDNLTPDERTFFETLQAAGMPLTDAALREEFAAMADDAGLTITNNSNYSPFWCFVTSAVVNPVRWLTAFAVRRIMPGLYVKTAGGALLDILAWSYGITRKPSATMQGYLTFTRQEADAGTGVLVIPAGTAVRSVPVAGIAYRVKTVEEAVIPAGTRSIRVLAEATAPGAAYNLGTTYYSIVDGDMAGRVTATNDAEYLVSLGADQESDVELRLRLRNYFTAVSDWHTDAKYKAIISSLTGFRVDRLFFVHDAPRGPGTADVYVLFDADAEPADYLGKVNQYIMQDGNHGHGDDVVVKALPGKYYAVRLRVVLRDTLTVDARLELLAKIETLVECAFRKNRAYADEITQTWPNSFFSFSKLDYELHGQFSGILSLSWEYRPATEAETESGQFDESAGGWIKGDIPSELDVPRLLKLVMTEVSQ